MVKTNLEFLFCEISIPCQKFLNDVEYLPQAIFISSLDKETAKEPLVCFDIC